MIKNEAPHLPGVPGIAEVPGVPETPLVDIDPWSQSDYWLTAEQWAIVGVVAAVVVMLGLIFWTTVLPLFRRRARAAKCGVNLSIWRVTRLSMSSSVRLDRLLGQAHRLRQAQIEDIGFEQLLAHHQAGGNLHGVVDALIQARRCGVRFDWDVLCRIDLTGRDPGTVVKGAAKPWTLAVPGDLLLGEPIPAITGDGVELRVRGEAEVISRPNEENPVPREPAMVAMIAQRIVSVVGRCRDHERLLKDPSPINEHVNAGELIAEPGLRLLRFQVTGVERGSTGQRRAGGVDDARNRIDRMLEKQPIEQMSADELAQLAPAYLQFGDTDKARFVCEHALDRDGKHERANKWLLETMQQAGDPIESQLAHVDRCIADGVEPAIGWRLIRASLLCRASTETDGDTGEVRIVDRDRYVAAADELRALGGADSKLARRGMDEGWIDSWDAAFPGIPTDASGARAEASAS